MPMGSCSGPLDLHRAAFVPPGHCAPSFPATHKRCRQERHQQQQQQQQGATSRHARSINHGMILLLRHDAAASRRQGSCVTLCDGVLGSCNGGAGGGGADGSARERQHDKLFMSLAQKMAPAERDSAAEAVEATGAAARPADFLLNSRQYRRRVVTVPPLQSEEQQQQQQWQLQQQQGYERSSSSSSSHSNHQHILAAASEPDQERRPSGGGVKRVSSGAAAPAAKINGDGGGSASASSVSGGVGGSTSSEGGGIGSNRGVDRMPEEEEEEAEFQTFGSASSSGRARRQRLRRQRERATMAAKKSLVKKVKVLGDTGQWRQAISEMDSAVDGGLPPDEYVYGSGVGAAASSGRWREALGVLRRMQEDGGVAPTTAVYNAAIKACARAGKAELAVALLEEMRTSATKADAAARTAAADTVGDTATDAAGAGGASAAEGSTTESTRGIGGTVSGAVLNGGRKAKEEVYSASRLNGAGRGREDEVAERSMGKDTAGVKRGRRRPMSGAAGSSSPCGCDPDIQTINTVMSACAKAGNWALALEVMDKGRRLDGLHPNRVTYNTAISACGRGGESDRAVRLLRDMRLDGLAPNAISYNSAIAACSVNGQWRRALSLLAEMEAAATAGAGDRGRGDKGRAAGPPPDRYSFSSAIAACGRGGQWSLAVGLLSAMRRKGIAPGVVAFNAAISACGAAGQWERAVGLLRDMEAEAGEKKDGGARGGGGGGSGFSGPDRVSFNAAINACSNAGEWQQAVSLLEEMRRNAKGDAGGEGAVLADAEKLDTDARTAGSGARDVPRGLAGEPQRQQSKDSGVLPSSENSGVDGVRRNGEGTSAAAAAAAVPLGAGASKADRRRQRRRRGKESRPGGPTPDVVTYSTAITACSRAGNWERALQLLEQMQGEDGLSPNSATFTTMIAAWRKDWGYGGEDAGGQEARGSLLPLLDSVAACGVKPDRRLYGSALDACADASLCERARTLLNEMVASGMEAEDRDLSAVKLACAARQRPPPPPPPPPPLSPPTPSDAGDEG